MAKTLPLNALLGQTLAACTQEFEGLPSLPVWSNVLRPIGDGIAEKHFVAASRLTKRSAKAAVSSAEKYGWVAKDAAKKRLQLTPRGAARAEDIRTRVDGLSGRFGDKLPSALRPLVNQLELELPHYPAGYGPADDSVTGSVWFGKQGDDWRPVARVEGDTTSDVPLPALLSQALVAFAMDFETRGLSALLHAACVLRILDRDIPIDDIPFLRGLPGNGKSVLERHLFLTISKNADGVKVARATTRGANVRDSYGAAVADIEAQWRARYGESVVDGMRGALEEVVADLDPALPHHVVGPLVFG